jgi:outer membrane phospholipase A
MNKICRFPGRGGIAASLLVVSTLGVADQATTPEDGIELTVQGASQTLADWEQQYLVHATALIYDSCEIAAETEGGSYDGEWPTELSILLADGRRRVIQVVGESYDLKTDLVIYELQGDKAQRMEHCSNAAMLPVASIIQARMTPVEIGPEKQSRADRFSTYEPNDIGWVVDDNSVHNGYLNALISFKYRFWSYGQNNNPALFFAFTTQFSQYVETIKSSPVVGKRYNPKLISRWWFDNTTQFVDIGYAHESNGQSINTQESYLSERQDYARSDHNANFARNYISRGWDYVSLDWTDCRVRCDENQDFSTRPGFNAQVSLKYFLDNGLFQGEPEEYNDWEGDGVQRRKQYDGIELLAAWNWHDRCLFGDVFCVERITWEYTTGYDGVFENNTNRVEFTINKIWKLPAVKLWARKGYNSSLVDYYMDVESFGISAVFETGY